MNKEKIAALSKEEFLSYCYTLSEEERLKLFVRNTEERYIWYKKALEDLYKDKEVYEEGDWRIEHKKWFKDFLREQKNSEEGRLKELRIEIEYFRAGMSPPSFYNYHKIKSVNSLSEELKKRYENGFINLEEINFFIKEHFATKIVNA